MITRPFYLHALSALHAGTGHAADIIDLPTARMKATGIPIVPGSSIKGVLRDARLSGGADRDRVQAVFGPETGNAGEHAGALNICDARLLALPVRSFRGTFAWVTSPLLLVLANRDLGGSVGNAPSVPLMQGRSALVAGGACLHNNHVFLEDLDLSAKTSQEAGAWASLLAPVASPGDDIFTQRFIIVDDETMTFLWETGTQVDTRVRLDEKTRTVAKGALWIKESLPSETLLIGLLTADISRRKNAPMTPEEVIAFALPGEQVLQFGGKASTGHGRCRLIPLDNKGGGNA